MNGWCSMIIWYFSYVANMYLWVFHGIPFLLHLVLSCTVWQVSRQISSERMRNGIGTLKVTATGATNEFLVSEKTSEKNPCLTSDLVQTFIFQEAQLEETFPAWVNNFNSSTLWILANEMLLFCSGAGRASKRRLLEMGLWLIYFLPKQI